MAKTLNQFLEGYLKVKSADEQKFIDKHVTAKTSDRNGNGDDVFKGSTKPIDRRKDRKGYNPGEDEKVYEELKGKQHKIDANKNGKLDAHDFKLLRAKKKVAEAVEELEELSKKTLGSYISKAADDVASKSYEDGYFGAQSGKKVDSRVSNINKAVKKITKEEAEQIDELSKKTLNTYRGNAYNDYVKKSANRMPGEGETDAMKKRMKSLNLANRKLAKEEAEQIDESNNLHWMDNEDKGAEAKNRTPEQHAARLKKLQADVDKFGHGSAIHAFAKNRAQAYKNYHMVKEEAEQIDELSKKTLGSYVKKAGTSRTNIASTQKSVDKAIGGVDAAKRYVSDTSNLDKSRKQLKDVSNRLDAKDWNRQQGINTAVKKLTKEESEQVDEGQKPYVSSDSAGDGRSAAAHVLDSKGKIVKSFHKKEHGADYMKKASEYLHQNYDKMRNEEAEGLDELSNATLGSYERKSGSDRSRDAGNQMAKRKQLGSNRVKVASTEMNKNRPKFEETSYSSKIASVAAKKYGLAERSQKVDIATLAKLRKEEKLANLISDISESQQRTMMTVFEKLNDENKTKFLEACDTPGGVEHMLDFAINNRGE